jgi:hypothetical protein
MLGGGGVVDNSSGSSSMAGGLNCRFIMNVVLATETVSQ